MAALLLVEDDPEIRRALIRALGGLGHVVTSVAYGMEAVPLVIQRRPELVILDLGLPDVEGEDVLRMVRAISAVPIIVATACADEAVVVRVLDLGADDYVVKPFGATQLNARVRAVLRRSGPAGPAPAPIVVGDLCIDAASRNVTLAGIALDLAPREFDLLNYLATRAGTVVGRRELLTSVWHQPYGGAEDTVDVHLSWLRRKLGETARQPRYLHTIRGVGVKLAEPGGPHRRPPVR